MMLAGTLGWGHVNAVDAAQFEDFDGGGNTPYTLTNSGGGAPMVMSGGPTGDFLRIVNLNSGNNNSIAFDENASVTGPAPDGKILSFDFRMSTDADNAAAGGCCDSAADGLGIGYFATPRWGSTGGINPGAVAVEQGGGPWERPAFERAVTIGLDVFQNIDVVTFNAFGTPMAEVDVQPFLDLNNGLFHRGILTVIPNPDNPTTALFDFKIVEDVHGAGIEHTIFTDLPAENVNPSALPLNRVIAGGRTGGAFLNGDFDNISVRLIPEPASGTLLAIAASLLVAPLRRRNSR
jgi:hypothetical protein